MAQNPLYQGTVLKLLQESTFTFLAFCIIFKLKRLTFPFLVFKVLSFLYQYKLNCVAISYIPVLYLALF